MHQTTIRFGSDLWESLAVAASAEGVSVAQYVRESAVERLVRTGSPDDGLPVAATDRRREARAPRPASPERPGAGGTDTTLPDRRADLLGRGASGRRAAARHTESSAAVWAQSRLARARSRELRAASRALIASHRAAREVRTGEPVGPGAPRERDAVDVAGPAASSRA